MSALGQHICIFLVCYTCVVLCLLTHTQSVLENKYDHVSAIYHLLVDRCKKHQAAIAAGQSAPPPQPAVTNSSISPTHLPIAAKFGLQRRRSSITTGVGQSSAFSLSAFRRFFSGCSYFCSLLVKCNKWLSGSLWKLLMHDRNPGPRHWNGCSVKCQKLVVCGMVFLKVGLVSARFFKK